MLKKFHLNKLSIQILFFVSLLVFTSVAITAVISISSMYTIVGGHNQEELETSLAMLEQEISDLQDEAAIAASYISADQSLSDAAAASNRSKTLQLITDAAEISGLNYITVTDKNGTVIARTGDPENYGDSLKEQPDIQAALTGSSFSGILNEKTAAYSAVATAPLFGKNGSVVGAVSAAIPLNSFEYLDHLKEITGNDYTVFSGNTRISTTILHNGERVTGTTLNEDVSKIVIDQKSEHSGEADILGEPYLTAYKPLLSPDGKEVTGVIFSGVSVSEIQKKYDQNFMRILLGTLILVFVVGFLSYLLVTRKIKRPLIKVVQAAEGIETGNIDESIAVSLSSVRCQNEIGLLARSMEKAVQSIERIATDTVKLAAAADSNDLTVEIDTASHNGIYKSIMEVVDKLFIQLHNTVSRIGVIAEQVSDGACHLSDGSQALAQGATEQAGAIEELFDSVSLIAGKAERNAENGNLATDYIMQAANGMRESNEFMKTLQSAMNDIDSSSEKISKIIKIIDDISFQTNILALNAAVEAARAGAAGKGFSVVADEVRALASKSAEAAHQTAELINSSIASIKKGTDLAQSTAAALSTVEEKAVLVEQTNSEITKASNDQAKAILDIKQRLNAISGVVQNNTATAEESASISEELSVQAEKLYEEVKRFRF
jgi:methyl-accepting chemotaxis protein